MARSRYQPSNWFRSMTESVTPRPSYRALLDVPSLGRVLLGMQIARIAQSMVSIVMILFALQRYNDAALAGLVAFASIVPGMWSVRSPGPSRSPRAGSPDHPGLRRRDDRPWG